MCANRFSSVSHTCFTRHPGSEEKFRMRFGPQYPHPATATFITLSIYHPPFSMPDRLREPSGDISWHCMKRTFFRFENRNEEAGCERETRRTSALSGCYSPAGG